jgi:adenylosuccinate lyase
MRDGLDIIKCKLLNCINVLSRFALQYKDMPTLGFTHFQPAQPTTIGKRACLWIQDLLMDLNQLDFIMDNLVLRGAKGTTGTQASFLTLFDGDHEKVKALDRLIAKKMGFKGAFAVTGQTYPRKLDSNVINVLSGIAQSAYKFSNDIRLLQHLKEIEEPFEEKQIGSSAMAYKRNPMRSERIGSLARHVLTMALDPAITASTQWLERTLDDSANRRIVIPQSFLAVDAILLLYINVADGLVVYPAMIERHLREELPFMATEYILMEAVKRGGDRQELHERIRRYSVEAGRHVKVEGKANDLVNMIASDPTFSLSRQEIDAIMDANNFVGRAPQQVEEFIGENVQPVLEKYAAILGLKAEIEV